MNSPLLIEHVIKLLEMVQRRSLRHEVALNHDSVNATGCGREFFPLLTGLFRKPTAVIIEGQQFMAMRADPPDFGRAKGCWQPPLFK